jgi:hypothetical protein
VRKLLAFVPTLAWAPSLSPQRSGPARWSLWQRLRISLFFVTFEGGMPLMRWVRARLGPRNRPGCGYLAGAAVIVIGAWMLLAGDKDEGESAARISP